MERGEFAGKIKGVAGGWFNGLARALYKRSEERYGTREQRAVSYGLLREAFRTDFERHADSVYCTGKSSDRQLVYRHKDLGTISLQECSDGLGGMDYTLGLLSEPTFERYRYGTREVSTYMQITLGSGNVALQTLQNVYSGDLSDISTSLPHVQPLPATTAAELAAELTAFVPEHATTLPVPEKQTPLAS
jgi:hypothetical protein